MADKLQKKPSTRRDRDDYARLKAAGEPAHINPVEDRLLRELLPEYHGKVVKSGLLADAGRDGDDRVTVLAPKEQMLLGLLGGSGTINPATGKLEFGDGMGGSDNPGGGHNGDSGPGSGGMGGPGGGGGYGGNDSGGYGGGGMAGVGGNTGFGGFDRDTSMYSGAPESEISTRDGGVNWSEYAFNGYKPADTWGRVLQEYFSPTVSVSKYGPTTGANLGIMGAMAGMLAGGPMSGLMGIGAAMGRASSPATQAASAAEMSARGSMNSTGQDRDSSTGLSFAELAARGVPGAASGSQTAGLLATGTGVGGTGTTSTAPGVPLVQPGGQVATDDRERTLTGLPVPVQNLLADYIWRGRQGTGFGW
jgi:hypothetical protein